MRTLTVPCVAIKRIAPLPIAAVLLVALFTTACVKTDVTVLSPNRYAPVPADSIRIFLSPDDILGEYEEIALLDVYEEGECSGFGFCPDREDMIQTLREKAGALGATGLVLDVSLLGTHTHAYTDTHTDTHTGTQIHESHRGAGVHALAIRDLNPNLDRSDVVMLTPQKYAPVAPASVRVFLSDFAAPEYYEPIALIDVYEVAKCSADGCPRQSEMIQLLRTKAGEIGADGILIEGTLPEIREVRRGETSVRVIAIRVNALAANTGARRTEGGITRIAVLPLGNVFGAQEQEYFAVGMTEALITSLAKISALTVLSRTSVMGLELTDKSLPEIARALNVDAVVEGSVLLAGERVRVSVHLIDAVTERHLWSESYERDFTDLLNLQSEVARAIAREIEVALTPQEKTRLASRRQVDPEAHDAYLRGRYHLSKRTQQGFRRAIEHFEQAIAEDPSYAPAYAGLADCYNLLGMYYWLPPRQAIPNAKVAVLKALQIDSTLAEAHTSLAFMKYWYDWDWLGAETEFQRALALDPRNATAHQWYATYLVTTGRSERAMAEIRRALELDPLSLVVNSTLGDVFTWSGRYDEAIEQFRRTLELDPNFWRAHWTLGHVYSAHGMHDEAAVEWEKAWTLVGLASEEALEALRRAHAVSGWRGVVEWSIQTLKQRPENYPFLIAQQYAILGQSDEALKWLEKAYEERSWGVHLLNVSLGFDDLRSDPRFTALLGKMGLE